MLNILIIDDNAGYRYLLRELLREAKIQFRLSEASNPLEALEEFKKSNYDFDYILCDFYLPIQNGNDFLEIVKSYNKNIRCFLMSADDSVEKRNHSYVDKFFEKSRPEVIVKQIELQYFLK